MANNWDTQYYNQPTVAELKQNAAKSASKAKKKGLIYDPVIVQGRKICSSWWGMAWCENLERYADYESRIDRGKRYVRNGSVIDLQIEPGLIKAKVQGSRKAPYKVEIHIAPLSKNKCQSIMKQCGRKLGSLETLLSGNFPDDMKDLFFQKNGLFPSPKEISFSCSCPDWALMCKHVAATLYGVGTRFDRDPLLFFTLRKIDINHFIDVTIQDRVDTMLTNAKSKTDRMLDSDDLTSIFGNL